MQVIFCVVSHPLQSAGGGVLLVIALVHLLPEIAEIQQQSTIQYPLCYFFVILGYTLLLFFEKVISQQNSKNLLTTHRFSYPTIILMIYWTLIPVLIHHLENNK